MHSLVPIQKTIRFDDDGSGTLLTAEVGYRSPGKALSLVFSLIRKNLNATEAGEVLGRVKDLFEGTLAEERERKSLCPVKRWL